MQQSVVWSMSFYSVVLVLLLVPISANTKLTLRALAAIAQCEAICISDYQEWYDRTEEPKGIYAPQCLEEISVSVESTNCDKSCNDSNSCLESCNCVHSILKSNSTDIPKSAIKGPHLTQPELFCREANILNFQWDAPAGFHQVFVTEYRKDGKNSWKAYSKTKDKRELISRLSSSTVYQMRVRALLRDGQLGTPVISPWTATLNDSFIPGSVTNITVNNMSFVNGSLNAVVSWTPSWDRTCFYELVFWDRKLDSMPIPIEISEKLHFELKNLEFGTRYYLAVRARSRDSLRESAKRELDFTTPSCFDMSPNLADCPPPVPQGLKVQEEESSNLGLYDIKVSWNASEYSLGYHLVTLTSVIPSPEEDGGFVLLNNVTGDTTETMFLGVNPVSEYQISVVAVSPNGYHSEPAVEYREQIIIPDDDTMQPTEYSGNILAYVISLSLIVTVLVVTLGVGVTYHRHSKRKELIHTQPQLQEMQETKESSLITDKTTISNEHANKDYYDDIWHISEDSLLPGEILGSGAFGVVKKGMLQQKDGRWVEVAIKMLPDGYTAEDLRHFRQEINIMQSVGQHPHIVPLVGCCTREGNLELVVEFCTLGDLQSYLRKKWAEMDGADECFKPESKVKYAELLLETSGSEHAGSNALPMEYSKHQDKQHKKLTPIDLLSFARQVAIGMEYLASCRVVHRDLAARNVLLTSDYTAKISDFGLSRDIYQENVYRKMGKGRLPVKWVAYESLLHQIYTTQSDVWSFGILLWEIVTLGGNPYPSISSVNELFNFLKQGYRMERPSNCSEELYDIMSACWRRKPSDRPTFLELHKCLDVLLESSSPNKYISLNLMNDVDNSESCFNGSLPEADSQEMSTPNSGEQETNPEGLPNE